MKTWRQSRDGGMVDCVWLIICKMSKCILHCSNVIVSLDCSRCHATALQVEMLGPVIMRYSLKQILRCGMSLPTLRAIQVLRNITKVYGSTLSALRGGGHVSNFQEKSVR